MFLRLSFILFIWMASLNASTSLKKSITSSNVYRKVIQLDKEILLIKEHFGISKKPKYIDIQTKLLPRHTWQMSYELFVKINILREKYNLPIIEPVNMEPTLELDSIFTYEQILRLIQEVKIVKFRFGIDKEIGDVGIYTNKTPTDVYNKLNILSREFDIINGNKFTPSYVFAEAVRIYEDFDNIFKQLNIDDQITPPIKENSQNTPTDSYNIALQLLESIKKIEINIKLDIVDFYAFKREDITPSDVFEITQIILAELQLFKAYIGLNHTITRGAKKYYNKTPTDVSQMLGWLLKKSNQLNIKLNRK
ncbi:MAG: hypothetical protein QM493_01010 [Sulfurovum sp.]